jgi:hypothetical protein
VVREMSLERYEIVEPGGLANGFRLGLKCYARTWPPISIVRSYFGRSWNQALFFKISFLEENINFLDSPIL